MISKASADFKSIRAETIEIVDPNGETRIVLDASMGEGYGCIALYSPAGAVINISINPDGSSSILFSKVGGAAVMSLSVLPNGDPKIVVQENGRPKVVSG